jgi:hypothetical protein
VEAAQKTKGLRYLGLASAIEIVLRELGGKADIDTVLSRVWEQYVEKGNGERVVMRLFHHPSGELWSPDAEEAIRVLEAAGVVKRVGRTLIARG